MLIRFVSASCLILLFAGSAIAADFQSFQKARPGITARIKGRSPEARLEAIRELSEFAFADAAKLLFQTALRDEVPENRRAAIDVLMKLGRSQEVCDWAIEQLNLEARKPRPDPNTPMLLAVLLASDLTNIQQSTDRFVDEQLAATKDGGAYLTLVADVLGEHGTADDLAALLKIAASRPYADQFAVRRAVIQAIKQVKDKESVGALIRLLPDLEGEINAEVLEYLTLATQQKFAEAIDWSKWWTDHRAAFVMPNLPDRPVRVLNSFMPGSVTTYYGLPLYAQRMVFVIDCSGSMEGPRIVAAKNELTSAVLGLRPSSQFSIIAYNSDIGFWRRQLVEATTANKADAVAWVKRIAAGEQTATYDALEAAFLFNAESLYLLTDGDPSTGRIVDKAQIVEAITRQNRARRESIYTIGIAPGPEGDEFDQFLSKLATQNFGLYKRVDRQ